MRGPWGALLLAVGALILAAGWLPGVLLLPPAGDPQVEAPSDLAFDHQGRLLIADREGTRVLTVTAEGRLVSAAGLSGPLPSSSSAAGPEAGQAEAWAAGLGPVRFDRRATSAAGGLAWLDPWTGTVLWAPASGGPPRLIHRLEPESGLRAALLLWWSAAAAVAVLGAAAAVRALWRWLRNPGTVAVRLAAVTLPWAVLTAGLVWWTLEDGLGPRDEAARTGRMLLAGLAAAEGRQTDFPPELGVRVFRAAAGGFEPAPAGAPVEELLAALRTGRPQVVRDDGLRVLVPGSAAGGASGAVAEVRWNGTPRWRDLFRPDRLLIWAGWTASSAAVFGALLWLLRRLRPAGPADPERFGDPDPWKAFSPRQWVESFGPDVLGPLDRGAGVLRTVVLMTWTDPDPEWAAHLGLWGALEVPTETPFRRAVFPGGLSPAASAAAGWTGKGAELPDLTVEAVRTAFGFVDTGFRQEPLVQGLPPVVPPGPGVRIEPRLRRRWERLLSVANRARSR